MVLTDSAGTPGHPRAGVSGVLLSARCPYGADEMLWVPKTIESSRKKYRFTQLCLSPVSISL